MVLNFLIRKHSVSIFVNLDHCLSFYFRKLHDNPQLYLYGSLIAVVDEAKFLCVIFDRKLSFIPHIKYLKAKCLKALNLLKVLSHTSWGADHMQYIYFYLFFFIFFKYILGICFNIFN